MMLGSMGFLEMLGQRVVSNRLKDHKLPLPRNSAVQGKGLHLQPVGLGALSEQPKPTSPGDKPAQRGADVLGGS